RAALKAIQRSIITPIDHPDMMNKTITTTFARMPICFHSKIGSQPTVPSSKSQAAKRWKLHSASAARFTTMSCFSSSELFRIHCYALLKPLFHHRDGACPVSVRSRRGQPRLHGKIGKRDRLIPENQSGQNCSGRQNRPGFPSLERGGRGGPPPATKQSLQAARESSLRTS